MTGNVGIIEHRCYWYLARVSHMNVKLKPI